jgi:hypothetical protein
MADGIAIARIYDGGECRWPLNWLLGKVFVRHPWSRSSAASILSTCDKTF